MAISEKSRSALYRSLSEMAGEEAAADFLSQFPSRDVDEAVTQGQLAVEMALMRDEMHQGFAALCDEMHQGDAALRTELQRQHNRLLAGMMAALAIVTTVLSVVITQST